MPRIQSRTFIGTLAAVATACGLAVLSAQQLNERCGGRSQQPTIPCAGDVTKMMAKLAMLPNTPPAKPLKPRKVLIWSRIPSSGYQHSSIPLASKLIEELGKKTGAWTSDVAWDLSAMTAENLAKYDAIFLSSTTGTFLDDNDQGATSARRKAFMDFLRGGKGIAGIHATGDSYHGGEQPPTSGTPPPPCGHVGDGPNGGGSPLWPEWDTAIGGYFKFHWSYPTPITVHLDDPKNPINAAFKGQDYDTIDEVYTFNGWSRDNVHVLTSIDYSKMTACDKGLEQFPRADHDYALSWIRPEGKGRLFYQALGHHESLYYNNPAFLQQILAGVQYALGDLKADDSIGRKK
jgi:type 1 glutamine amidotransferase